MKRSAISTSGPLFLMLVLMACGGGGTGAPPPGLGTLAYVETQCRGTAKVLIEHQRLRIRQGDREPVTVFETPEVSVPGKGYVCQTGTRYGEYSISREAFQAVTVSPDGSSVAFEVTDEFSINPPLPLNLPQKGIFWVRADGTGLRLLGPPSHERFFFLVQGVNVFFFRGLSFSPNGRTIVFVDKGPDADGHEADQVVTIDVATGTRTQVTHLPPAVPPAGYPGDAPTVQLPLFVNEQTISFSTSANPNGFNPGGQYLLMTIKTDGSGLDVPLPVPVPLPGGQIELRFIITGDKPVVIRAIVPGEPTNNPPLEGPQDVWETFVSDESKNILQLTNFRRVDTLGWLVDVDREHI
jgi:WD40 repeat protein